MFYLPTNASTRLLWPLKQLVFCGLLGVFFSCSKTDGPTPKQPIPFEYVFSKSYFEHDLTGAQVPYHFFQPQPALNTTDQFPLIIALHGMEYFVSPEAIFLQDTTLSYFALAWMEPQNQAQYPAFVLAPNIHELLWTNGPYSGAWDEPEALDLVDQLLADLLERYPNIDEDQIFLTGHSAGGLGTWYIAAKLKDKIAAAVPLSSAFSTQSLHFPTLAAHATGGDFADLPIWSFIHKRDADGNTSVSGQHGCRALFQDFSNQGYAPVYTHWVGSTPYNLSAAAIDQAIEAGKIHFYTEYNYPCHLNCHYAMTQALKEPALFKWLFQQKRRP